MSIAERFGMDWRRIWEHGDNAELRRRRGNPNILHPGDTLHIPPIDDAGEPCALEKVHTFRIRRKCAVRIVLYDELHQPMANVPYHFTVSGVAEPEAKTGGDGVASTKVELSVEEVDLTVPWGTFPILLGHLDPANTVRGAQQRLNSLGFDAGAHDGEMGPRTRAALAAFQQVESLEVNGFLDKATIQRLRKVHDGERLGGAPETLEQASAPAIDIERPPEPEAELDYDALVLDDEPGWN